VGLWISPPGRAAPPPHAGGAVRRGRGSDAAGARAGDGTRTGSRTRADARGDRRPIRIARLVGAAADLSRTAQKQQGDGQRCPRKSGKNTQCSSPIWHGTPSHVRDTALCIASATAGAGGIPLRVSPGDIHHSPFAWAAARRPKTRSVKGRGWQHIAGRAASTTAREGTGAPFGRCRSRQAARWEVHMSLLSASRAKVLELRVQDARLCRRCGRRRRHKLTSGAATRTSMFANTPSAMSS
jgi:hypothetical protein